MITQIIDAFTIDGVSMFSIFPAENRMAPTSKSSYLFFPSHSHLPFNNRYPPASTANINSGLTSPCNTSLEYASLGPS